MLCDLHTLAPKARAAVAVAHQTINRWPFLSPGEAPDFPTFDANMIPSASRSQKSIPPCRSAPVCVCHDDKAIVDFFFREVL